MCQVSRSEAGFVDPSIGFEMDFVECAPERGIDHAGGWHCGGNAGAQEAAVEAREERAARKSNVVKR